MNKKKFSYILFIVFLFSFFNVEVKADAKDLSCYYYNDSSDYVVLFTQTAKKDSKGSYGNVYAAKKDDVTIDGKISENGDWGSSLFGIKSVSLLKKDNNYAEHYSYFNSCPSAITWREAFFGDKPSTIYAFPSATHEVYLEHTKDKKFIAMTYKGKFEKYIDNNTEIEATHEHTYNKKTCDNVDWITKPNSYASCLYTYYVDDSNDNLDGCFVVQIDFDESGKLSLNGNPPNDRMVVDRNVLPVLDSAYLKNKTDGRCPRNVHAKEKKGYQNTLNSYQFSFEIESRGDTWLTFSLKDWDGKNLNTGEDMTDYEYEGYKLGFISAGDITCADVIGEDGELVTLLNMLVNLVKILVPILLIVLGSLDFVKAIFSGDDSNMKKAQNKFIKRLIIGIVLFLAPSVLKFMLGIASNIWPVIDADLCGIL